MNDAEKSVAHRTLTLGDFLFCANAVPHLLPETLRDSQEADVYWRPLKCSVPLVLSLIDYCVCWGCTSSN